MILLRLTTVTFALPLGLLVALATCGGGPSPTAPAASAPATDPATVIEPSCGDPAPLEGTYDPRAPGYIVSLEQGTDAQATADDLAARYGFEVQRVFQSLPGFSAELTPEVVAAIRCEPVVVLVEYDGVVQAF